MTRHLEVLGLLLLLLATAGNASRRRARSTRQGSPERPELVTNKAAKLPFFSFGENGTQEQQLIGSGRYIREAILPYDTQPDSVRNRLFVTTPNGKPGTPATLSTLDEEASQTPLVPYPSLDVHRTTEDTITDCSTQLISVVTTTIPWTDTDTLYALDSGVIDIITNRNHACPPKICIFDLTTDKLINCTEITNARCNSLYTVIQVESCPPGNLVAYTGDPLGFRLTVTDLITGVSRHLQSQYFYPSPGFFFVSAGGPRYRLVYGLDALAVDESCNGKLYLQSFSSNLQGVLEKEIVRNAKDGEVLDLTTQVVLPGHLAGVSGPLAVDPAGERLFFPIQDQLAIYCWNTSKPHHQSNFRLIAQDAERLQYMSSLKVDAGTGRLWITSNRFTRYLTNTTDFSQDNYYITYIDISALVC